MYLRVLVPLDGSRISEQALPYARILALAFGAEVVLVRVLRPLMEAPEEEVTVKDYLKAKAEEMSGGFDLRVGTEIRMGDPVDKIVELAYEGTIVVMTSRGLTGLQRAWLGSVAQGLIYTLNVPILVIKGKPPETFQPPSRVERVIVGLDGSFVSEQVLPHASAIARALNAELHLIHVIPPILGDLVYMIEETSAFVEHALSQARRAGQRYLREKAEMLSKEGLKVTWRIKEGKPPDELIKECLPDSILALTTYGRTGLGRWLLGSITERVLQTSPCPVFVVRAKA